MSNPSPVRTPAGNARATNNTAVRAILNAAPSAQLETQAPADEVVVLGCSNAGGSVTFTLISPAARAARDLLVSIADVTGPVTIVAPSGAFIVDDTGTAVGSITPAVGQLVLRPVVNVASTPNDLLWYVA